MPGGFIKLYRSFATGWTWDLSAEGTKLILWLLFAAHWPDDPTKRRRGGRWVPIHRGQLLTSQRELAIALDISRSTVQRILAVLTEEGFLSIDDQGNAGLLVTVQNFDRYQGTDGPPSGPPTGDSEGRGQKGEADAGESSRATKRAGSKATSKATSKAPPFILSPNREVRNKNKPGRAVVTDDAKAMVKSYRELTGSLAGNARTPRQAQKLIDRGLSEEVWNAIRRYAKKLQDNPPDDRRFIIKPHNWFGREARWTEYQEEQKVQAGLWVRMDDGRLRKKDPVKKTTAWISPPPRLTVTVVNADGDVVTTGKLRGGQKRFAELLRTAMVQDTEGGGG